MKGIEQEYLVEINSGHGKCYIASAGGMPERENAFYYGDADYEFCFYATRKWRGDEYDVEVTNATVERFHGSEPFIRPEHKDRITANIATFFATYYFASSAKPIPSTERFGTLTFSWGV
jgi:hypothetical protein